VTQTTPRDDVPRSQSLLRRIATIAISIAALAAAVLLIAFAIETLRMHRLKSYPPPGETYTTGGATVHMDCTGAGSPTILLESGLGDDFLSWRRVQPALSHTTRVCSYDRAGYGWSSPRQGPRDAEHIAEELHELMTAAHIDGPIVLMGHSMAGVILRIYASRYPAGIAAMVFVDASTPTQAERLPKEFSGWSDFTEADKLLRPFGVTRMRGHCGVEDPATPELNALLQWHDCTRAAMETDDLEGAVFAESCREANATGPFGDIPILIFSQDPAMHFGDVPFSQAIAERGAATWNTLQEELKQLSPRSRRIIARGSTHYIHQLRPELVIREVQHLIGEIRGSEPPRSDYGSTTIQ
jgi:pimeloyl-ACP methyl ester carboxylesterase